METIRLGMTFLAPSGPSGQHLFVITCGPNQTEIYGPHNQYLIVNFSTIREGIYFDPACVIQPKEHEFFNSPSFAFYKYADNISESDLIKKISNGLFQVKQDCSSDLLHKVQVGASNSKHIRRDLKMLFSL